MAECVNDGRLMVPWDNGARPAFTMQITNQRVEESELCRFVFVGESEIKKWFLRHSSQRPIEGARDRLYIRRLRRQPMVRFCSRRSRRALNGIKPTHVA